jgi:hypothetical protein
MIIRQINSIKLWVIGFFIFAILGGIIAYALFNNITKTNDEIAVAAAIPIILSVFIFESLDYGLSFRKRQKDDKPKTKLSKGVVLVSMVFLIPCFFLVVLLLSVVIYNLVGFTWAVVPIWNIFVVPLSYIFIFGFIVLILSLINFIIKPYWADLFKVVRERSKLWWVRFIDTIKDGDTRFPHGRMKLE